MKWTVVGENDELLRREAPPLLLLAGGRLESGSASRDYNKRKNSRSFTVTPFVIFSVSRSENKMPSATAPVSGVLKRPEPLTTPHYAEDREEWVKSEAARTARAHQSYLANNLSSNTVTQMARKENLALADADGGGTIDRKEFETLLAASSGNVDDVQALFAAADVDGDGELTEDEIKALAQFKEKHKTTVVVGGYAS